MQLSSNGTLVSSRRSSLLKHCSLTKI